MTGKRSQDMFFHIVDRTEVRTAFLAIEEEEQDVVEIKGYMASCSVCRSIFTEVKTDPVISCR
jgi:transcription initiation factor IIE alpha subunit